MIPILKGMHKQERNQIYSDTAIQCCLIMKFSFRLALQIIIESIQSLIRFTDKIGQFQITPLSLEDD